MLEGVVLACLCDSLVLLCGRGISDWWEFR